MGGKRTPEIVVAPLIGGRLCTARGDEEIEVINPSTGKVTTSFVTGGGEDVDLAVRDARAAFHNTWERTPPSVRKLALLRLAELIEAEALALDLLDAGDMGKPVSTGMASAKVAAGLARFYAEAIDKCSGDVHSSDEHSFVCQRFVPRGVVAAITPWNFPTMNAMRKIAPALASGNCVVLKPSELAPRSAMRLAELALEAGMPPGALNIVPGSGETVGAALALHNDVDMITFTGSTLVGKKIMECAGRSNLKVVMAECGGKSPQILFDDGVNLEDAVRAIAGALLTNQGQICSVGSRLLVSRRIEASVIELLKQHFSSVKMGDATDPETTFGPVASKRQYQRVLDYIKSGDVDGAELEIGGEGAARPGYFINPTLFRNVQPSTRLAQEEIFGPVLAVVPFDDEAQALRIANGTIYGLAAYVWTASLPRAMRMMKGLRSTVRINASAAAVEGAGHAFSSEPSGQSGVGVETGLAGMQSYLRKQGVWISYD